MPRYGRRLCLQLPALHPLLEPVRRQPLRRGPCVHVEPAEVVYVFVGDPATAVHDGHQPLLGPTTIPLSYCVELLYRLSRQRPTQRPAKLRGAPLVAGALSARTLPTPCAVVAYVHPTSSKRRSRKFACTGWSPALGARRVRPGTSQSSRAPSRIANHRLAPVHDGLFEPHHQHPGR
jgi:hypothetical protein